MKRIDLIEVKHDRKIGEVCEYIEPNVTEDSIFYVDGEPIGFYLTKMPEKMCKLSDLADKEFRSNNVPKSKMNRGTKKQAELFKDVKEEWRFGNLFTSSISNYNISAPFHRDNANIKGAVNVIICKKHNSKGGDLHVPDYGATIGQQDNSILVYPAWRNLHAVTPILPTYEDGYRNSLIFYPLKAFKGI